VLILIISGPNQSPRGGAYCWNVQLRYQLSTRFARCNKVYWVIRIVSMVWFRWRKIGAKRAKLI